jgi:hypothetical protein
MIIVALYLLGINMSAPAPGCEELGPRLDGTYVTVCAGSVVRVRDGLGNSRGWAAQAAEDRVILRAPGSPALVLAHRPR